MDSPALVEVGTLLRVLHDLDLLHLSRFLGILNVIGNLQVEPTRHDPLHLRKHFSLEDAVHQRVSLLL